jgi:DNA polymerase-3 subunit alpha
MIFLKMSSIILIFDIETHAFTNEVKNGISDLRCVQLAWQKRSVSGELLGKKNYLIQPDQWVVSEKAANLHGISTEKASKEGKPLMVVAKEFAADLAESSLCVGHNLESLDVPVICNELKRCFLEEAVQKIKTMPRFCTMKAGTDVAKIPGFYGKYKWPKLSELYSSLFAGKGFEGAHDASVDVEITAQCYFKLQDMKRPLPKPKLDDVFQEKCRRLFEDKDDVKLCCDLMQTMLDGAETYHDKGVEIDSSTGRITVRLKTKDKCMTVEPQFWKTKEE